MHRLTFTFIYLFIYKKLIILVHKKLKLISMIDKEINVAHFGSKIVELNLTQSYTIDL